MSDRTPPAGFAGPSSPLAAPANQGMNEALVRVVREHAWQDRYREYIVEVDGRRVGKIRGGEVQDFPVRVGEHTVRIKIDWTGSKALDFEAKTGTVCAFSCRPRLGIAIVELLLSLFRRDRWVILEPATSEKGWSMSQ
jgi:hypothetical protein